MKITDMLAKEIENLSSAILDDDGLEINSPVPRQTNIRIGSQLTLNERVARIFNRLSVEASMQGMESEQEANDFDIPDVVEEQITSYEIEGMIDEVPYELRPQEQPPASPTPAAEPSPNQGLEPPPPSG